jgi:hypothetical protein
MRFEEGEEFVCDRLDHVDPIGREASLARVGAGLEACQQALRLAEEKEGLSPTCKDTFHRGIIQISVLKHNNSTLSAQLHKHRFEILPSKRAYNLPHRRRADELNFPDGLVGHQGLCHGGRVLSVDLDDVYCVFWEASVKEGLHEQVVGFWREFAG